MNVPIGAFNQIPNSADGDCLSLSYMDYERLKGGVKVYKVNRTPFRYTSDQVKLFKRPSYLNFLSHVSGNCPLLVNYVYLVFYIILLHYMAD